MTADILLITPPFTQLNTPYPATAYLKGFLNTKNISSFQCDLGIEVTNAIFSQQGLQHVFTLVNTSDDISENAKRICALSNDYINTINAVMSFLQGKNPTMANRICKRDFLPEAGRFNQLEDLDWAFGTSGTQDKAKYIATLYLEDISDFLKECIDPHFGFSRYAEKLGRCASSFDELDASLQQPFTYVDKVMSTLLKEKMEMVQPKLVCLSVPFPGNLYASLLCGQFIKQHFPQVKVAMGGGFANTELRSLADERVFTYYDFITLDDGEAPIECLYKFINEEISLTELKRTFTLVQNKLAYINNSSCKDYAQAETGTPDYSDFKLDQYISAMEVINPMHSLWSDGRWNKLTMAHGCYWGKCTFCDISLDYIKLYEPVAAALLADRMEQLIAQTGQNGFHFVDEAAPPALMRALSLEIIKRNLVVTWWANIRFEKSFSRDLCILLKSAGCIAVSGGLEVASDRLLKLIDKGITVSQVARVTKNFKDAGIMVHAYLMYGFPTQTEQETIDSLEMVRQMFETGILQSAFWHLFTMTAHSPVGLNPEKYKVRKLTETIGRFANNDIAHEDITGADHESFSYGLKKSMTNFLHNRCLDLPVQKWFDFKVPKTSIAPDYIRECLLNTEYQPSKPTDKVVWLGNMPTTTIFSKSKKGQHWEMCLLVFESKKEKVEIKTGKSEGLWLAEILKKISIKNNPQKYFTLEDIRKDFESSVPGDFDLFWGNKPVNTLYSIGLLHL
ncbi:MAG: radical SAM protein [Bacteroidetes bacterium]|nr:radical SAM protein [Bacteroidota bacterium]